MLPRTPSFYRRLVTFAFLSLLMHPPLLPAQSDSVDAGAFFEAVQKADVDRVRMMLGSVPPNIKNAKGETPLMIAASQGNFEICRALLWSGADANLTDKSGKRAREHLKRNAAGFTAINLLLRSHAFVQLHETKAAKPARPNLVVISDSYIDHDHPALKEHYWVNKAELKGKPGVDDDGDGFVDAVYGWNADADEPLRSPLFANVTDQIEDTLLKKFVTLYNRSLNSGEAPDQFKGLTFDSLTDQYENPLVRQLGFDNLKAADLDIDDKAFTEMLVSASHGTHVAGIVLKASNNRALLHGMTHGRFHTPKEGIAELIKLAREIAPRTLSYEQFMIQLRSTLLETATRRGKRRSDYLRSLGAGVVNMSWSHTKETFIHAADAMKSIYQREGMDPKSTERYTCPAGMDLCSDLGLELLVAAAAELALMIHENPDVLFVMAAGNESENNDEGFPSPAYLSRLFPNVITVASVNDDGELSDFSNFGVASVQVAAPGENIRSSFLSNQEGLMSGTSMAAPAVAGLAALLRSEAPKLSANDIRLILERSTAPNESLHGKIATGGIVNEEQALKIAAQWQPGSRADLTLAAITAPQSDSPAKGDANAASDDEAGDASPHKSGVIEIRAPGKGTTEGMRISAIGGFADKWQIIMARGTGLTNQAVYPKGPLPIEWIQDKWKDGWEITSIGGENKNWRVVMSERSESRAQKIVGLDIDQASLSQFMNAGYRITQTAGYSSSWVFVLTAGTGWTEQRYTLPGPFDQKRKDWINSHSKDGYRITGLAGDNSTKEGVADSWLVVMSQNSGLGDQVFTGPAAWPTDWIHTHEAEGYRITQTSGYADHWVIVMSKGTPYSTQIISGGGAWSDEWIQAGWNASK